MGGAASVSAIPGSGWQHLQQSSVKRISFPEWANFRINPTATIVVINYFDIDTNHSMRLNAHRGGVSRGGLLMHLESWGTPKIYGAGAPYLVVIQ